jgi:hypothetical protein
VDDVNDTEYNNSLIGKKSIDNSYSILPTIQTSINSEKNVDKNDSLEDLIGFSSYTNRDYMSRSLDDSHNSFNHDNLSSTDNSKAKTEIQTKDKKKISEDSITKLNCNYNQDHHANHNSKGNESEIPNNGLIEYANKNKKQNIDTCETSVKEQQLILNPKIIYKIVEYRIPYKIYYINERLGQICYGILKDPVIYPLKSIINIVPRKLTYYSNPIFPKAEPKVQLEFNDGLRKGEDTTIKIGPCNNINELIKILENNGYILYKNKSSDAFNSIVNAMKENGIATFIDDVTTPGYYLVKNKIINKDTTQKTKEISKEDAEACCHLLDKLAEEGWFNKKIFPTVLKWSIISPFSFIIKQLDKNNFLPWLILYGQSKSGKSTLGEISARTWRIKDNDKGFSSIDTAPKLGQILSQNTYPVLINEVGVLSTNNNFGKYNAIIEMMKSSVTGITARSKFFTYSNYTDIPALSPLILTSNHKIIEDSGFLRRFIGIHFAKDEQKSVEQQENFNKLNLDILGILGDFVSQNISIDILKKDWKVTSGELLKKFYRFAGREEETIPNWIDLFEEQKDIEDEVNEKKYFELRAFFIEEITRCYSLNNRSFLSDTEPEINIDIISALNFCLKNKLLPFLHEKNNEIIITIDIMKKINIPNIVAFKDISSIIDFEYTSARIGEDNKTMKVLKGNRVNLCKYLDPAL